MRKTFPIFVATRFIQSKNTNGFLSFIAWISMIGLVLGITALIIVTSVLNGFQQALDQKILGMVPHTSIINRKGFDNWEQYAREIINNDSNVIGVAPFITTRGMISIDGEVHGSIINGIDSNLQSQVSILPKVMVDGTLSSLQPKRYNIILGKSLVEERGLSLGDKVSVMLTKPNNSSIGITPIFHTFTLSGVFSVSQEVDSWMSYINIEDAAAIKGISNKPTGLRLKLKDLMAAELSAKKSAMVLAENDADSTTATWQRTHQNLFDSIQRQKRMMALLLFLIIVVAIFNIISALVMMTTEKKSEIAILKTIGASKQTIMKIFLAQGFLIGALGTVVGLVFGVGLTLIIEEVSRWVNTTFNLGLFDSYYVTALPAKINIVEISLIVIVSLIVCALASIYPALKAANSLPVEGLKYD